MTGVIALSFFHVGCTSSDDPQPENATASITSFSLSGLNPVVNGVISEQDNTIRLIVPEGTVVTSLTPLIELFANATVTPASGVAQDFSKPVIYTVTSTDGSKQNYTVTVILRTPGLKVNTDDLQTDLQVGSEVTFTGSGFAGSQRKVVFTNMSSGNSINVNVLSSFSNNELHVIVPLTLSPGTYQIRIVIMNKSVLIPQNFLIK